MNISDLLASPFGEQRELVNQRQDSQWQIADQALTAAGESLAAENYEAATAAALVGLLALQLSRT